MEPLQAMGASLWARGGDAYPPLSIRGGRLAGIDFALRVASAQVASCVLLAGLFAEGETIVRIPGPARDHTERMLAGLGVPIQLALDDAGGRVVRIIGPRRFVARDLHVPGDPSAAAFFLAAAAAAPGARVTARGVSLNPTRTGLIDVLELMGATVERSSVHEQAGEVVGDVTVVGPDRLMAVDVPVAWLPRMIDEVPAWAVAAARAHGTSRLRGASELRVKETDRLAAICESLGRVGISAREADGGFDIEGGEPRGGELDARGDHRIAMAFAVLGTGARGSVVIDGAEGIATSDPAFVETLASLGGNVSEREAKSAS
jgi:3-phosphoshikimate 1-carboxyvinyltransferase